ncbi:hypothetical protein HOG27_00100 [bacterium]|jgi:hypothetical protein|nr:hypothetical protein [bacterium]
MKVNEKISDLIRKKYNKQFKNKKKVDKFFKNRTLWGREKIDLGYKF